MNSNHGLKRNGRERVQPRWQEVDNMAGHHTHLSSFVCFRNYLQFKWSQCSTLTLSTPSQHLLTVYSLASILSTHRLFGVRQEETWKFLSLWVLLKNNYSGLKCVCPYLENQIPECIYQAQAFWKTRTLNPLVQKQLNWTLGTKGKKNPLEKNQPPRPMKREVSKLVRPADLSFVKGQLVSRTNCAPK